MMKFNIRALTISTIATVISITIITIVGELSEPFKNLLKNISGHHWTTKSIFSLILFIVLYFLLLKVKDYKDYKNLSRDVAITVIVSSLVILLFYTWHFFSG